MTRPPDWSRWIGVPLIASANLSPLRAIRNTHLASTGDARLPASGPIEERGGRAASLLNVGLRSRGSQIDRLPQLKSQRTREQLQVMNRVPTGIRWLSSMLTS